MHFDLLGIIHLLNRQKWPFHSINGRMHTTHSRKQCSECCVNRLARIGLRYMVSGVVEFILVCGSIQRHCQPLDLNTNLTTVCTKHAIFATWLLLSISLLVRTMENISLGGTFFHINLQTTGMVIMVVIFFILRVSYCRIIQKRPLTLNMKRFQVIQKNTDNITSALNIDWQQKI